MHYAYTHGYNTQDSAPMTLDSGPCYYLIWLIHSFGVLQIQSLQAGYSVSFGWVGRNLSEGMGRLDTCKRSKARCASCFDYIMSPYAKISCSELQ